MRNENAYYSVNTGFFFLVLIALFGLLSAEHAFAYKLIGSDWKYNPNPMGKVFEICLTNAPGGAEQAIKDAAKVWEYPKFKFTFKASACSSGGQFPTDNGTNQIDFGALPVADAPGATKPFTTDTKITECDVRFNPGLTWHTGAGDPPADKWDLRSAVVHELGHCLGLGDTPENPFSTDPPVMEKSLGIGQKRRTLTQDDKDGRAAIYGK
jgi:hypothetical protein